MAFSWTHLGSVLAGWPTKGEPGSLFREAFASLNDERQNIEQSIQTGEVTSDVVRATLSHPFLECIMWKAAGAWYARGKKDTPQEVLEANTSAWVDGLTRRALEASMDGFVLGPSIMDEAILTSEERVFASGFRRMFGVAAKAGFDPAALWSDLECVVKLTEAMNAYRTALKNYLEAIRKGTLIDPIEYIREGVSELLDGNDGIAGEGLVPGNARWSRLQHILNASQVSDIIPDYRDLLEVRKIQGKNIISQRLDLALAILAHAAEHLHGLVEAGEIDPKYNLYEMAEVEDDLGGTRLERRRIVRDSNRPDGDPSNHVNWPNTKIPRFLTKLDFALKDILDRGLQPLANAYLALDAARDSAILHLTLSLARLPDLFPCNWESAEVIATEMQNTIRNVLSGFHPLCPEEQNWVNSLDRREGLSLRVAWLTVLLDLAAYGGIWAELQLGIAPETALTESCPIR